MSYQNYDLDALNQFQTYDDDGMGDDLKKLMNDLVGQQKRIQSTLIDEDENLQSQITQNAGEIDLRVKDDEVISSINLSPESIKIESDKIILEGAVTVLSKISDDLGSITAGDISGVTLDIGNGTFQVDEFGNLTATSATIEGTFQSGSITSNTQINVATDAYIGNDIFLGDQGSTTTKTIHINDSLKISGGGTLGDISFNAGQVSTNCPIYDDYSQVFSKHGTGLLSSGNEVYVDFGTSFSEVARGDHSHSEYASSNHNHDDDYAENRGSEIVGFDVTSVGNLAIYSNGSLLGYIRFDTESIQSA